MQTHNEVNTDLVLSTSSLLGSPVRNSLAKDLGRVEELMINAGTGGVAYVVISSGGTLGFGEKLFAVPWRAVRIDKDQHCLIFDVSREQLDAAPGFDKDNWPDLGNSKWAKEVELFWETCEIEEKYDSTNQARSKWNHG